MISYRHCYAANLKTNLIVFKVKIVGYCFFTGKNQSNLDYDVRIENEVSTARDVSQWKLIRDREQVQGKIYIKFNNIKMILCQMINFLYFKCFYAALWQ